MSNPTKQEWKVAHDPLTGSKEQQKALLKRAMDQFFYSGGTLTRREKSGALTFWKGPDSDNLRRVAIQEAKAG